MVQSDLVEQLKKTNRLYAVVSNVNQMVLKNKDPDKIFSEACRIAVEEGQFTMAWIGLADPESGIIKPKCWAGHEDGYLKAMHEITSKNIPAGRGPTGTALREKRTIIAEDFKTDPRLELWREEALKRGYASSIALPIFTKSNDIGAFTIYSSEKKFFTETEIRMLEDIVANIAFAIEAIENERVKSAAEKEIADKNKFIKTVTDSLPGIVAYWNKDLRCTFANSAYKEWFGREEKEMIGIHIEDLLGEELYTLAKPYFEKAISGETQQFERELKKRDGSIGYLYMQLVPNIVNNEVLGYFILGSDITKLKEVEFEVRTRTDELAAVHSRYVSFLENMQEGLHLLDKNYRYLFANKTSIKQSRLSQESILGHTLFECFPGIENTDFFARAKKSMEERVPQTFEYEHVFPDGDKQWFEIHISPSPEGILFLVLDIDERKKISDELKSAYKAREEEKLFSASKMAALGEMASGIAHEINNPLSIIIMKVIQLRRKFEESLLTEEELDEGLKKISTTAQRIGNVVKGLSSISRNAENDPMKKVNALSLIEDTLQLCRERFKSHLIDLHVDLDNVASKEIEAKAPLIMQVLLNLLNNAFDAVSNLPDKWIAVQAISTNTGIQISITDSGRGIPDSLLGKIMQPFFTTKAPGKGTGLGLSISKGIIDEHHGQFYYKRSSPNTCFVVELPYSQNPVVSEDSYQSEFTK